VNTCSAMSARVWAMCEHVLGHKWVGVGYV